MAKERDEIDVAHRVVLAETSTDLTDLPPLQKGKALNLVNLLAGFGTGVFTSSILERNFQQISESLDFNGSLTVDSITLAVRIALGVAVGTLSFKGLKKIDGLVGGRNFKDSIQEKNILLSLVALAQKFKFFLPWLALTELNNVFHDFSANAVTIGEGVQLQEKLSSENEDPSSTSAFAGLEENLQRRLIQKLDENGNMSEETAAEMALFEDGNHVRINGLIDQGLLVQSWQFTDQGTQFTVDELENGWAVFGGHSAWELSKSIDGPKVLEYLTQQPENEKKQRDLEVLNHSALIDGTPAIKELSLGAAKCSVDLTQIPTEDSQTLTRLFIPNEFNRTWRKTTKMENETRSEQCQKEFEAAAALAYENNFGVSALSDPNSYASVVAAIESSQ